MQIELHGYFRNYQQEGVGWVEIGGGSGTSWRREKNKNNVLFEILEELQKCLKVILIL